MRRCLTRKDILIVTLELFLLLRTVNIDRRSAKMLFIRIQNRISCWIWLLYIRNVICEPQRTFLLTAPYTNNESLMIIGFVLTLHSPSFSQILFCWLRTRPLVQFTGTTLMVYSTAKAPQTTIRALLNYCITLTLYFLVSNTCMHVIKKIIKKN